MYSINVCGINLNPLIGYDIDGYKSYFMKKNLENTNMLESMVYVSLLKLNLLIIVTLYTILNQNL